MVGCFFYYYYCRYVAKKAKDIILTTWTNALWNSARLCTTAISGGPYCTWKVWRTVTIISTRSTACGRTYRISDYSSWTCRWPPDVWRASVTTAKRGICEKLTNWPRSSQRKTVMYTPISPVTRKTTCRAKRLDRTAVAC